MYSGAPAEVVIGVRRGGNLSFDHIALVGIVQDPSNCMYSKCEMNLLHVWLNVFKIDLYPELRYSLFCCVLGDIQISNLICENLLRFCSGFCCFLRKKAIDLVVEC